MKKNVASQKIGCQMCSATDGSAFTSTVTVYVTVDAGVQALGATASGVCTHEGNGYHTYAPSQGETNGDLVAFTFIGTGAIPATIQIYTRPTTGLLAPTTADRTLDVSTGGEAGVDWANVGSPTTTVALSGTTVKTATDVETDTADIQSRLPAALGANGNIKADVRDLLGTAWLTPGTAGTPDVNTKLAGGTAWGSGAITAGSIANDAITDAKVASDVTIASVTGAVGSVTGAVGSVTGAVGSVTGNVGGNVTGSVGSVVGAVGSVTARVTANTDQLAGQTVAAAAGVTFPTSVASPTNITAGTITTVTNLTNAATAGDFTSTMKTSIGTAVAASAVASVTGAVGSVTGNVGGNVTGSVGSLATQAKADVNAEVVDAIATDTYAEPGQGTPAATLSLAGKLNYLFKAWRNKSTQTSTAYNLFNDDAATVDQKATTSDDDTTFTRGEITTGP